MKGKKYVDIDQLEGWNSIERWKTKNDENAKKPKEVIQDGGEHLRLCRKNELPGYRRRRSR